MIPIHISFTNVLISRASLPNLAVIFEEFSMFVPIFLFTRVVPAFLNCNTVLVENSFISISSLSEIVQYALNII